MCATFQNTANTMSITLVFTLVMGGHASSLPRALYGRLTQTRIPNAVARGSEPPPTATPFAAVPGMIQLGRSCLGERYIYEHGHPGLGRAALNRRQSGKPRPVTILHSEEEPSGTGRSVRL